MRIHSPLAVATLLAMFLYSVLHHAAENATSRTSSDEIRILSVDGVINPLSARYLRRELSAASAENVQAFVLLLNTPGGLESSMREMVQDLLNSSVPVIVYVTPQGARAASAGMFLTIAAHVAVMAPGTNIGAAHPVSVGQDERSPNEVMNAKAVNDAAALARAIATERGRNAAWAERAVRSSASLAANEAVAQRVVDFVAQDLDDLLKILDGREIKSRGSMKALQTANIRIVERPMHFPERVLHTITDPNIAYLLLSIGFIGILAEFYSPGLLIPGVSGVVCLLIGFSALGSMPIGWAGLSLLLIGLGLLALEIVQPGVGVVGLLGVAAFVLGSLMLYTPMEPASPALPRVRVHPLLIASIATFFFLFVLLIVRAAIVTKKQPHVIGAAALIGKSATATTDLSPQGTVRIDREHWSALIKPGDSPIRAGEQVEVVANHGAILEVKKNQPVRDL